MNFTDFSLSYTKRTNSLHKSKTGQFFSSQDIIKRSFKGISIPDGSSLLEPSFGSGEFFYFLKDKNINIDGVEMEKELYDYCCKEYNGNFYNEDFLKFKANKKYDFIVGNPPYFVMTKRYRDFIKKEYADVIYGRVNIYQLFVKKCIDLLEDDGYLIFIIPASVKSGKYFSKLREYIVKHCRIVDIIEFNKNDFMDTDITPITIILQKTKNDGRFTYNGIFYEDVSKYNGHKTISDLGCKVMTGNFVWSGKIGKDDKKGENKRWLTDDSKQIPLLYSQNIGDNTLVMNNIKAPKKQYIKKEYVKKHNLKPISAPFLVVNRTIGYKNKKIKVVLVNDGKQYMVENHVNYITGDSKNLAIVKKSLEDKRTAEFINDVIGVVNLSKTELETLIPVWI